MIIRSAKLGDICEISKMEYELNKMHVGYDKFYIMRKNAVNIFKILQLIRIFNQKKLLLVAENKGELVGFISAVITNRPSIFIERKIGGIDAAYVKKKSRKKGIGKQLADKTFSWFKSKGVKYIEVTTHKDNIEGINAWNKFGFKDFAQKKIKQV